MEHQDHPVPLELRDDQPVQFQLQELRDHLVDQVPLALSVQPADLVSVVVLD